MARLLGMQFKERFQKQLHILNTPEGRREHSCESPGVLDQAQTAGTRRQMRPARVQKITPSVPNLKSAAGCIPEEVQRAAEGCVDADQLMLQTAFLDMYSTSEHKVRLLPVLFLSDNLLSSGPTCRRTSLVAPVISNPFPCEGQGPVSQRHDQPGEVPKRTT